MAENSSTSPATSGNTTISGTAAVDSLSGGGGSDTIFGGSSADHLSGDSPLSGQWQFSVYDRNFSSANNQTQFISSGTLVGNGYVDDFGVRALRNTLGGTAATNNREDYGVIYRSNLSISTSGSYTFSTSSDDGSRIIIRDSNGAIVFNLDNDFHQSVTTRSGSVTLTEGQTYSIEVYFWENLGGDSLSATIAGPGFGTTDLATSALLTTPPLAPGHVDGNDSILGDAGNDTITGGGGNDQLYGGADSDSILGEAGQDQIYGGDGADRLFGGSEADLIYGGTGADTIEGGTGNDTLLGEDGDDLSLGGAGADSLFGGADRDYFSFQDGDFSVGDSVDGGNGGVDYDILDLSGYGWARTDITYTTANRESGFVDFFSATGVSLGRMFFTEIEEVIPCFTAGTLIDTPTGPRPVESLQEGDLVLTLDDGPQPVRWVGHRSLGIADLLANPDLRPITLEPGSLGPDLPERTLALSPQHRVLLSGPRCELYVGEAEALAPAIHLAGLSDAFRPLEPVIYVHLMFDRHQIVRTYGVWSETFQPGAGVMLSLPDLQRDELFKLFPELAGGGAYPAARSTLKSYETRILLHAEV